MSNNNMENGLNELWYIHSIEKVQSLNIFVNKLFHGKCSG